MEAEFEIQIVLLNISLTHKLQANIKFMPYAHSEVIGKVRGNEMIREIQLRLSVRSKSDHILRFYIKLPCVLECEKTIVSPLNLVPDIYELYVNI